MLSSFGAEVMGRAPRADEAGAIYHMLNRANRRAPMFLKNADFEAFEGILAEALDRVPLPAARRR